jgi:hypothetical protein
MCGPGTFPTGIAKAGAGLNTKASMKLMMAEAGLIVGKGV